MKRVIGLVCLFCIVFSITVYADTNKVFKDVSNSFWAKSYIDAFVKSGVIDGYTDGTFKPDNNVSREEFCKLLVKTFNADENPYINTTNHTFSDVEENRWSYKYVEVCSKFLTGYVNPFGGKPLFKPAEIATREDIAVALVRMLGYTENDVSGYNSYANKFKDKDSISPNLRNYVGFATQKGLINGYPDGSFGAQKGITRAETIVMLDRALKVSIADAYEEFNWGVNLSYRSSGKIVDIEVVANSDIIVTVNGEIAKQTESSQYLDRYVYSYSYTFKEAGVKEFIIEGKRGSVVKKEIKTVRYNIATPEIKITECPSDVSTNSVQIRGKVTCDGAIASDIIFTINDKEVSLNSKNEFSYTYTFDREGSQRFIFKAECFGKEKKLERVVNYSLNAPVITLSNCPSEVKVDSVKISGTVSDENYKKSTSFTTHVSLTINNRSISMDSQGKFTTEVYLEPGVNKIIFVAKNDLGKTTQIEREIKYVKEYTAPELYSLSYPKTTSNSIVEITGKVKDNNVVDLRSISLTINGEIVSVDSNGSWSKNLTLVDGVNRFTIIANNSYGKSVTEVIEIIYTKEVDEPDEPDVPDEPDEPDEPNPSEELKELEVV